MYLLLCCLRKTLRVKYIDTHAIFFYATQKTIEIYTNVIGRKQGSFTAWLTGRTWTPFPHKKEDAFSDTLYWNKLYTTYYGFDTIFLSRITEVWARALPFNDAPV